VQQASESGSQLPIAAPCILHPMALLTLIDAELAYGLHPLLDRAGLSVEQGERIGLIGRNGTGKSSLLKVIAGLATLDEGELKRRDGLRVEIVEQEPELPLASSLRESLAIRSGLDRTQDERERWRLEARLVEYLHRFGLDPAKAPDTASGGERKRAALALALAHGPDLLLLDEPTNHLDIDGITLLEDLLLKGPTGSSAIVITHDRAFLDRVVNRIVELDRGLLRSYPGNFAAYENSKADQLAAESVVQRKFDRFWAQEEVWIRKGIEARRTRNEGRVRRLEQLRRERAARRERLGHVKLALDAGERSGRLVAELTGVCKRFGARIIVQDLSLRIMRGDRFGLIGPNGAGKSTLLKLILGELAPDAGEVRFGTNVQVAYFDQMREQLDPERTLLNTISSGSDWVQVGEERKHVMTYLADFLFPAQRANAPVKMLSGGERNRLLLARLFARPANVLVLDEPTNDLDIESLELLEDTLQGYPGTLLLVSHDRAFLDNVVTQTLAPEGNGRWREYVGGYSDWLAQRSPLAPAIAPDSRREGRAEGATSRTSARIKLSFKEARELERLPGEIEALEREQHELTARMSRGDYYKLATAEQGAEQIKADRKRPEEIERQLAEKFERWAELDAKANLAR
jgi:ATP-binding cassette subfamily F protein uup